MNRETKSNLSLINAFIIVLGIFLTLGATFTISKLIQSPQKIAIPVRLNLNLADTGHLHYEGKKQLKVSINNIKGTIGYKSNSSSDVPINWVGIGYTLTRVSLLLFVLFLTHKFMQTTIEKSPFLSINANRMRWIGYSLVFLGLLRFFIGVWNLSIVEEHLISQYVDIENCYSAASMGELTGKLLLTEMPIGLFSLFIAAIFKHGIELRKENELTI